MAKFEVPIVRIDSVEKHPDADRLTLNRIGGYVCISNLTEQGTPRYATGDLVAYVPENALVPESILKQYGYWNEELNRGYLDGPNFNRVRPRRLRGVYSEGLMLPVKLDRNSMEEPDFRYLISNGEVDLYVEPGDNVAMFLGITKYEPEIPDDLKGACFLAEGLPDFDVEAIERYMDEFIPDEPVYATEKLHGVCAGFSYIPGQSDTIYVYSKGLGAKGMAFHTEDEHNNLYIRQYRKMFSGDGSKLVWQGILSQDGPVHLLGEIVGRGVQDLHYGFMEPEFILFDIYIGEWGRGRFLEYPDLLELATAMDISVVPCLYSGGFDWDKLVEASKGMDSLSESNIREGVVIRPASERSSLRLKRVCLKLVNSDYKLRKGGGEELS